MSKTKYSIIIVLSVLIAMIVYSSILFLLVNRYNEIFYISYGFTIFSFFTFLCALLSVLIKPRDLNTAFLNEPYLSVSVLYTITQFVFGVWSIFYQAITWQLVLSCDILFCGIYLILILLLIAGISMNKDTERDISYKKEFIKYLQIELTSINVSNFKVQKALNEFLDDIKYSDPISHNNQQEIELEKQIIGRTKELIKDINNEMLSLERILQLKKLLKRRNEYIRNL